MSILIRKATVQDIDWLTFQLGKFSEFFESKYKLFGDIDYIKAALVPLINNHPFFIAENEIELRVGFISGNVFDHPFNPNIKTLLETFWWVDEAHRNSRAGAMLLNEFINYGKQNCNWIVMTLEHNSPIKEESLLKRGFRNQEHTYLMEI